MIFIWGQPRDNEGVINLQEYPDWLSELFILIDPLIRYRI
jgi:hypothetical protein